MKPKELYARAPESCSHELGILHGFYYNHIPELEHDVLPAEDPNGRVLLRWYKNFNFDGRRFWALAAVCFDGLPFMIIQNAGREGDDWARRFITDEGTYWAAMRYLKTIALIPEASRVDDVVDPDVDIKGLTDFYGNSLDDHFEMHRY